MTLGDEDVRIIARIARERRAAHKGQPSCDQLVAVTDRRRPIMNEMIGVKGEYVFGLQSGLGLPKVVGSTGDGGWDFELPMPPGARIDIKTTTAGKPLMPTPPQKDIVYAWCYSPQRRARQCSWLGWTTAAVYERFMRRYDKGFGFVVPASVLYPMEMMAELCFET